MKVVFGLLTIALLCPAPSSAGPLQRKEVASDAKWLLHLDIDRMRETRLGSFLIQDVGQNLLRKAGEESPFNLKLELTWLHSITAYGPDFEGKNGVLLVRADRQMQENLKVMIQGLLAIETNAPIKHAVHQAYDLYSFDDEVFAALSKDGTFLLAPSKREIDRAGRVLEGKAPSLSSVETFQGFPEVPEGFFFLAIAEGFNKLAPIPPQAQVLQMAEGGRIVLGEKSEKLFAHLALKTRTQELSSQLQQVIQGALALLSFANSEQQDLVQIARSAKVSTGDKVVSIAVEYPVKNLMERIDELDLNLNLNHGHRGDEGTARKPPERETKREPGRTGAREKEEEGRK